MKKTFTLFAIFVAQFTNAQNPLIVKTVSGTEMRPYDNSQQNWQSNQWNGLFFYFGTGTPTKLCVTDGTTAGTKFLADVGVGLPNRIFVAKDFIYAITSEVISPSPYTVKNEIWRSDGTAAGTTLVYTMPNFVGFTNANQFGSNSNTIDNFSLDATTNLMYFAGYDATNGNELWVTDGTAAGTHIVKDIKAGTGNSNPWGFCKIGNEVFFNCTQTGFERKLWKTDGTAAGTVQIAVAEPFFIVNGNIGKLGNKFIFDAHNTVDGYEKYVSDGTAAGTFMLSNINPGGDSYLAASEEVSFKSNSKYCFFIARNGTDTSLYRTDGTGAGTIRLTANGVSLRNGVSSGGYSDIDESGLWMVQYNSVGGGNAEKIWKSDGTLQGTYMAAQNISYGQKLKIYKNALWMQARNIGSTANTEPWRCGGNQATTNIAFEIRPENSGSPIFAPFSSDPFGFFVKNNKLYFFATRSSGPTINLYEYNGDFTFNGSLAGGKWKDSANWNSMMPPGITDTVFVNAGTPNILNVEGGNGYAGIINIGNNANINFVNATDTLFVNNRINALGNNTLGYPGTLALKNITGDTVKVDGGFDINNIDVLSPSTILSGSILAYQKISFTSGKLYLNDNNFRLNINTIAVANANNYFVTNGTGSVIALSLGAGLNNLPKFIPIGTAGNYAPVTITNTGDADNFSARVINTLNQNYTAEIPSGLPYVSGAVNHTWFINEVTAGGSDATIALQWNAAQELPLFNRTQTYLGHYTGGIWNLGTQGTAAGGNPYSFSRSNITSFSPFGIMNNNAVLPLNFISFNAQKCSNQQVCLTWKTSNEQNVSHFEIERSTDAANFVSIAMKPANNQPQNTYTATDDIAALQSSTKIYYRIKEVDKSGFTKLSNISLVRLDSKTVTVYPTVVGSSFTVQNDDNAKMLFRLSNTDGKAMRLLKINAGTNIVFTDAMAAGIYFYQVYNNEGILVGSGKIIKQ